MIAPFAILCITDRLPLLFKNHHFTRSNQLVFAISKLQHTLVILHLLDREAFLTFHRAIG